MYMRKVLIFARFNLLISVSGVPAAVEGGGRSGWGRGRGDGSSQVSRDQHLVWPRINPAELGRRGRF